MEHLINIFPPPHFLITDNAFFNNCMYDCDIFSYNQRNWGDTSHSGSLLVSLLQKMFLTKCTFYFILVKMKGHHLRFLHLWNIAKNKNNFHFSEIKHAYLFSPWLLCFVKRYLSFTDHKRLQRGCKARERVSFYASLLHICFVSDCFESLIETVLVGL